MKDNQVPNKTTVLIVGGGPAGSLAACFLVQEGIDVVICEKDKFPRYHIGESMLPSLLPLLEFAGIREEIDNYGFIKKYGAHWRVKHDLPDSHTDFRIQPKYKYSYQVIRSEFDELLLNCAQKKGANVYEETNIQEIIFEGDKPVRAKWAKLNGSEGEINFDYLIDASGLAGMLSNRYLKNRKHQPALANIALCQYWENFNHYKDDQGKEYPGEFVMNSIADGSGWIWAIPLHNSTISIGAVISEQHYKQLQNENITMDEIYHAKIDLASGIKDILSNATPVSETKYWNDYSYFAEQFSGNNFRLAGDSAAFLDPLLSSGLHVATVSALSAAATICAVINGDCSQEQAAKFHDDFVRSTYTRYLLLVTSLYQQIRNQDETVLHGVTSESIQSVFDIIQPMLTGNYDIEQDQAVGDERFNKVTGFMKSWAQEFNNPEKSTDPSQKPLQLSLMENTIVFDRSTAINGLYIRLEKGKLGLQKVNS